jgi:hypothetical protein
MGDIVVFEKPSKGSVSGECKCIACKHEWVGVAEIGTFELECPQCQTMKGVFKRFCSRIESHFQCNCGCEIFGVTDRGIYCLVCGSWVNPYA